MIWADIYNSTLVDVVGDGIYTDEGSVLEMRIWSILLI